MRSVSRSAVLSLLLFLWQPLTVAAQEIATLTLAEGPLRVIRGATVLRAAEGVRLHQGDILESANPGFAQLEFAGGTIVALGPSTRVFLFHFPAGYAGDKTAGKAAIAELVLLSGWLKGEPGSKAGAYRYATPQLAATTREGTVVLHATGGATEIFVESGSAAIGRESSQGDLEQPVSARAGQFFSRAAGKDVTTSPRFSPAFLDAMPRSFRDTLPSRPVPARPPEAQREHEVTYSEIQPWLIIQQNWRRGFVERFQPRLKDAAFHKELEAHLDQYPEWTPILHPEKGPPNPPAPAASSTTERTSAAPQQTTAVQPSASTPPQQATMAPAPTPPAPQPPPVLGFDEAVAKAAHAVFTAAPPPEPDAAVVVIDPLVDGMSGYQSKATQTIQDRIARIVKDDFPQYAVHRISPESLKQRPRVLVGTFTPVNAEMKTTGVREAYRFCLVMGDLNTGKVVAKSVARARIEDVDATPLAVFNDSPVWTVDPSIQAYIATCQASKVGDPIKPEYLDGLLAAGLVSEADAAYDESHYAEALGLYRTALKTPAGDQLRVHNGIYLSLYKLRRGGQARAFRDLVDYGIRRNRLAVKFLFRPGSLRFATSSPLSNSYDMWLQQIAAQTVASKICWLITGHTSPTGSAALNDSLSLLRAEYIQSRLEEDQTLLKKRTIASGVGSRENLVGTGRDDASDELDRRVELKPINPCP